MLKVREVVGRILREEKSGIVFVWVIVEYKEDSVFWGKYFLGFVKCGFKDE